MKTTSVSISDVELDQCHPRVQVTEEGVRQLATSIASVGVLHPILVQEYGDRYVLVTGKRRVTACKLLGLSRIPAVIVDAQVSDRQIQLIENLQREDLDPVEKGQAVQAFLEESNLSKAAAARQLGIPRTTLNDWLAILDIDPKYQQAVINNYMGGSSPLSPSHVALCKRFAAKMDDARMFEVALDAVLYYRLTRAETKRVLQTVAEKTDYSITKAVRKIRLLDRETGHGTPRAQDWDAEQLVSLLSRSGDYLVKCKMIYLQHLNDQERNELVQQSKALGKLLERVIAILPEEDAANDIDPPFPNEALG